MARQQNTRSLSRENRVGEVGYSDDVVRLASGASLLNAALSRDAHLRGSDAPSLRVLQGRCEQIVDQSRHGTAQPPAFMIQRADDDPVDAGRIMGSPGHGGG